MAGKKSERLRVLILGAGAMARKHAAAYRELENVEIVAVANRGALRAAALADEFAIPECHQDYRFAVANVEADIVSICVPTVLHSELAVAAMHAGMHVVTEKPIALTLEAARRMIDVSGETNRKLTVVFNRRFNSVWEELRRRLDSIGEPMMYNVQEIRSVRPKPAMHSRSANGGPVIDCCVHDFDMLLQLFGRPVALFATGLVFGSGKPQLDAVEDPAIDTAHVTVEFEAGHRACLLYAWGFPAGPAYWQHREFMGPDGIIRLMGEFGERVDHYRGDGRLETVHGLAEDGHHRIIRSFVEAIVNNGNPPVTAQEGLAALELSIAALASIEQKRRIEL